MPVPISIGRLVYRLYQMAWTGLDWLYPPQCVGCSCPGARWCLACQEQVELVSAPLCQCCGQPLVQDGLCVLCQTAAPAYTALRSWAVYADPLRKAVHRLKYMGDIALGEALARPLIDFLHDLNWPVEWVVPVPAGSARLSARGYNQASLLARPLALAENLLYKPQALYKTRDTRSQVGLTAAERRENIQNAFAAAVSVKDRILLVVDDVTTSGATMQACAQVLRDAGAKAVYGLTLARAGAHLSNEDDGLAPAGSEMLKN